MKKDVPRSRKDYLIRHHLERTTGAGELYGYFDMALFLDIKWHGRNLIVIKNARGLFVQHPLSVFIFYLKGLGRSDFSVFPAFLY